MSAVQERLGARQLATAAGLLSETDRQIIGLLGRHQVASSGQIRRLLFASHKNRRAAAWSATHALGHLRDLGLIDSLPRRIGGWQKGSAEAVWYLSSAGWRLADQENNGQDLPARLCDIPSQHALRHRLAVTETWVRLSEAVRAGAIEEAHAVPEPACWREFIGSYGQRLCLKPDLFATTVKAGSDFEDVWFIEVDMGTESLPTIQRKLKAYEAYHKSGVEQTKEGVFPRVVWLVLDEERAAAINTVIAGLSDTGKTIHKAMTLNEFIKQLTNKEVTYGIYRQQ
jgi:hypothetical protein